MTLVAILKLIFAGGRGRMLKAGDRAPALEVPDQTGKMRKLSDFAGQTVVLWFYPKADTPG